MPPANSRLRSARSAVLQLCLPRVGAEKSQGKFRRNATVQGMRQVVFLHALPVKAAGNLFCSRPCKNKYCNKRRKYPPIEDRFWSKVNKTDTCWLWTGALDSDGYGHLISTENGKHIQRRMHRYSWTLHFGEIEKGLCVCHRCDTPACVRPDHLFLGTSKDNNEDRTAKGRQAKGETDGNAKLKEWQVLEIRRRHSEGECYASLALAFGVSRGTVRNVALKIGWKHV